MLKLYPLFSGSSGNMYLVKSPEANILVDIGVSYKTLVESLDKIGSQVSDIDALFITHEHSDHVKGLSTFINKTSIPIYASCGTVKCLRDRLAGKAKRLDTLFNISNEETIKVKDIAITSFEISHDAVMPFGYTIKHDNSVITIATDLGYVSDNVYKYLLSSDLSIIESNYDNNLLMYGPYTYPLKRRIQSDVGHLSNLEAGDTIINLAKNGKRNFLLGHLSHNNNEPDIAKNTVCDMLKENGFNLNEFNICLTSRHFSDEVYEV